MHFTFVCVWVMHLPRNEEKKERNENEERKADKLTEKESRASFCLTSLFP